MLFEKTWVRFPEPICQLTTICDYSSRKLDGFLPASMRTRNASSTQKKRSDKRPIHIK